MKRSFLTLVFALSGLVAVNAQAPAAPTPSTEQNWTPSIQFDKETHDYGTIKNGGDGTCEFTFTNTGKEPFLISNARGSCGCTVPEWPKEPIAPGAKGTIKVKYDTKRSGPINKSVTISSNAVNEPEKVIRIKGEVGPAPESGVPVNNSGAPTNN